MNTNLIKARQSRNDFFKPSKKQTNEFDSNTMIPQVDLLLFVFWKKFKTLKDILKLTDF